MSRFLERVMDAAALRRWRRAVHRLQATELPDLRAQRTRARRLRAQLDGLIHAADARLARPRTGANSFSHLHGADWSWRPDLWRGPLALPGQAVQSRSVWLHHDVALHHDCTAPEIMMRQVANLGGSDLAPFGLCVEVFHFAGSYLSLSVELPASALAGLGGSHLIRAEAAIEAERAPGALMRLNIQHGPNTEQILPHHTGALLSGPVDFDLAQAEVEGTQIEKVWLDLIFAYPGMNRITVRDLTLCRYHRADF